jgi:hypothetical protein
MSSLTFLSTQALPHRNKQLESHGSEHVAQFNLFGRLHQEQQEKFSIGDVQVNPRDVIDFCGQVFILIIKMKFN